MFINITDSETGNNKGSCVALVNYLEKENRLPENKLTPEFWFNGINSEIRPQEVRVKIDNNIAKLGRNDAKFFLLNISPSQKECQFMKQEFGELNTEELLKKFAIKVMDEYARNFQRPGVVSNSDLLWYGKLEHYRYYSFSDSEVKQGLRQKGERKEGEQMHIQIIVSRKDITNKIKLSPMNNSRGRNASHSAKLGQFDRKAFKQSGESLFDEMFGFERVLKDSMKYAITMRNGSSTQKKEFFESEKNILNVQNLHQFSNFAEQELIELFGAIHQSSELLLGIFDLDSLNYDESSEKISNPRKQRKIRKKKL